MGEQTKKHKLRVMVGNAVIDHVLKTDSDRFKETWTTRKKFEIRFNDRDYELWDRLWLRETVYSGEEMMSGKPLEFTGRGVIAMVTHILHGPIYGLADGWVILSLSIEDRVFLPWVE